MGRHSLPFKIGCDLVSLSSCRLCFTQRYVENLLKKNNNDPPNHFSLVLAVSVLNYMNIPSICKEKRQAYDLLIYFF